MAFEVHFVFARADRRTIDLPLPAVVATVAAAVAAVAATVAFELVA